ncbi:MAG: hypothetical protein WCT20_03850, partial [Candidatus Babeliales bacterium]
IMVVKKTSLFSWQNVTSQLTPTSLVVDIKSIYADTLRQDIMAFVKQQTPPDMLSFSPESFSQEMKKKFPIIGSIEWTFSPSKELRFTITGLEPRYIINNQLVLTERKKLFPTDFFSQIDLRKLPSVNVAPRWCRNKIARRVNSFLAKVSAAHFQHFAVEYYKPSLIKLYPKKSLFPCFLITDEKSFFDEKKYTALTSILADIQTKGFLSKKITKAAQPLLAFDLRFEKTIAVKFFDSFKRGTGK